MNESKVKEFYDKHMKIMKEHDVHDITNEYYEMMSSRKPLTNDELLELAKYMIYDAKLNGTRFYKIQTHINNGYNASLNIFNDMSERGVIFDIPMVTQILNQTAKYCNRSDKSIGEWLLNMMKNGYTMSKIQYKKIIKSCAGIPIKHIINNEFICSQDEFELLPFLYKELSDNPNSIKRIKKIIKKSNVKITDKFIGNLHTGIYNADIFEQTGKGESRSFYLQIIKEFGNKEYQLKRVHFIRYLQINTHIDPEECDEFEKMNDEIIMYYVKNIKNLIMDINFFVRSRSLNLLTKLINENADIIDTNLIGNEEIFVKAVMSIRSDVSCIDILNYFNPKYTEKLFDYACIYQNITLINNFIENNEKIPSKKIGIACKSGYYKLINYLLDMYKNINICEENILDFAIVQKSLKNTNLRDFTSRCRHMEHTHTRMKRTKTDEVNKILSAQSRNVINKMISLVKISNNTKLILMDMELYEMDREYETYRDEMNPERKIIPNNKLYEYDYSLYQQCSEIMRKFVHMPLESFLLEITRENIKTLFPEEERGLACIILENDDPRILNYLEYKYNFKPSYYQIIRCTSPIKRMHLLSKYYPCKN